MRRPKRTRKKRSSKGNFCKTDEGRNAARSDDVPPHALESSPVPYLTDCCVWSRSFADSPSLTPPRAPSLGPHEQLSPRITAACVHGRVGPLESRRESRLRRRRWQNRKCCRGRRRRGHIAVDIAVAVGGERRAEGEQRERDGAGGDQRTGGGGCRVSATRPLRRGEGLVWVARRTRRHKHACLKGHRSTVDNT